jgi:hypothetical protein
MERKFDSAFKLVDALKEECVKKDPKYSQEVKLGALSAYLAFAIEHIEKVVKVHDRDTDPQVKLYNLQVAAEECRDFIKYLEAKCTE